MAKRLDGSRCHLVRRLGLGLGNIVLDGDPKGGAEWGVLCRVWLLHRSELGTPEYGSRTQARQPASVNRGPCLLWRNSRPSQQLLSSWQQ